MSAATQSEATLQSEATVATRFDRTDWLTIATMGGIVLALHLFGWGVLVLGWRRSTSRSDLQVSSASDSA